MQGGGERGLLSETCLRKEKKNQQNMLFRISVKEKNPFSNSEWLNLLSKGKHKEEKVFYRMRKTKPFERKGWFE